MRGTAIFGAVLGLALSGIVPASFAGQSLQPHRVCDWVGPGGRAVYRCTVVYPEAVSDSRSAGKTCGWIGPGGRAIYACR